MQLSFAKRIDEVRNATALEWGAALLFPVLRRDMPVQALTRIDEMYSHARFTLVQHSGQMVTIFGSLIFAMAILEARLLLGLEVPMMVLFLPWLHELIRYPLPAPFCLASFVFGIALVGDPPTWRTTRNASS